MLVSPSIAISCWTRERLKAWITVGSVPLLKLEGPIMVWLNVDTRMVISWVETFPAKVWNSSILHCQDLTHLEVENTCQVSPEGYLDFEPTLITKLNVPSLLLWASLQGNIADLTYFDYDTDDINRLLLYHLLYLFESNEWEPLLLDLVILFCLCDISILVEGETVVVLDGRELLISQLDLPIREQVDLVLSNHLAILFGSLFSEECRLYLCAILIYHLDVHQSSLAPVVLPPLRLILSCHSCPYTPVRRKLI